MKQKFRGLFAVIFTIAFVLGTVPLYEESVEAAFENNTVISIGQYESVSKDIANDISSFVLSHHNRLSITRRYSVGSKQEFIRTWNQMAKKQTVVFINMHGNAFEIGNSKETFLSALSASDINSLQWKEISFIILTGCNCGHYDWRNENIARALADRFRCTVIACDGSPRGHDPFIVDADDNWKEYCSAKGSYRQYAKGWLAYVPKSSSNNYQGKLYQIGPFSGEMTTYEMLINYCKGYVVSLPVK